MSLAIIDEQYLSDIGDAIRSKNGETELYYPSEMAKKIKALCSETELYGFQIDQSGSDSYQMVTYTDDSIGKTPAAVDLSSGEFNYGDWADAFFMPKPCMLKYDGTVDYYLDPNDYTLKEDGTASDVANTAYGGNAMMEWPVIYASRSEDGDIITVKISNGQVDETYKCWSNIDFGKNISKFYTPIYNGSAIDGKMRSLSGQKIDVNHNVEECWSYAKANGDGWDIECIADRWLINDLLVLISKNIDTQTAFGAGFITGGTQSNMKPTGTADKKGLFYGTNDEATPVKVFGMENYWGQQWRWMNGWILDNNAQKVKLTHGTEDGSTVEGYNTTGNGYVTIDGATPTGTSGGYISKMKATEFGLVPVATGASGTTKYCDALYYSSGTRFALVGGASALGRPCGAFSSSLGRTASYRGWRIGAALSYKQTP